jgi:hypothetical protein
MKITMIGKSGVGKTSFMSGMHEALNENSILNFSIIPSASNLSDAVTQAGKFDAISYKRNNYSFPPGTQKTTLWSFDLCYASSTICELEWIDYRGGILDDMFSSANAELPSRNKEIEELLGHISISNGVILFADSVMLSRYDDKTERSHHSGARVINRLLKLFANQYPNRNLSLVIALTKADSELIKVEHKADDYKILIERGKEAFEEVINLCHLSYGRWYGGILPIGCVGEGKVESSITPSGSFHLPMTVNTKITGLPTPFNVEHPLFYTIGYTLSTMKDVTNSKIEYYKQQIQAELEKSSILRDFWCKIRKSENPKEVAQDFADMLQKEISLLNRVDPYIRPLLEASSNKIKSI